MTMDKLNKDLDNTPQNTVKFKTETNFFRNEQIEETKMNKSKWASEKLDITFLFIRA